MKHPVCVFPCPPHHCVSPSPLCTFLCPAIWISLILHLYCEFSIHPLCISPFPPGGCLRPPLCVFSNTSAVTDPILIKVLGPNFLGALIFVDQHFYRAKLLLTRIFLDQNFFVPNLIFFLTKIFWPKHFLYTKFFGPKMFLDPKFCGSKIFRDPTFFGLQSISFRLTTFLTSKFLTPLTQPPYLLRGDGSQPPHLMKPEKEPLQHYKF